MKAHAAFFRCPLLIILALFAAAGGQGQAPPGGPETVQLVSGLQSTEGPVWDAARQCVFFSDQDGNKTCKWSEANGLETVRPFTQRGNGNALDADGYLIQCESDGRRVLKVDPDDGSIIDVLADEYDGKAFNGPNDVTVKSDGTIWFTDPTWEAEPPQEQMRVYRYDPATESVTAVINSLVSRPNGLGFSPDESVLYVNDNGNTWNPVSPTANSVWAFPVNEAGDGVYEDQGEVMISGLNKWPDGMAVDESGNLYICVHSGPKQGVNIYEPDGTFTEKISMTDATTNCCLGGPCNSTLFITSGGGLFKAELGGPEFTLTAQTEGEGTVTADPAKELYDCGETVTLTAEPAAGHEFAGWSGAGGGTDNPLTVTMDGDKIITALFEKKETGNPFAGVAPFNGTKWTYLHWLDDTWYPWLWVYEHGWWYCFPINEKSGWFWDLKAGWFYAAESYPWLYSASRGCWLWYYADTGQQTRHFTDVCTWEPVSYPMSR